MAYNIYSQKLVICFYFTFLNTFFVNLKESSDAFCPFFSNRAPKPQPSLKNCTWYSQNSCCTNSEIQATFVRVKPLKGASKECQYHINYLMCYICSPRQHLFYSNERLSVCEEFCDNWYHACGNAELKGQLINKWYSSGKAFCKSRSFEIVPISNDQSNCLNLIESDKKLLFSKGSTFVLNLKCFITIIILHFYLIYVS